MGGKEMKRSRGGEVRGEGREGDSDSIPARCPLAPGAPAARAAGCGVWSSPAQSCSARPRLAAPGTDRQFLGPASPCRPNSQSKPISEEEDEEREEKVADGWPRLAGSGDSSSPWSGRVFALVYPAQPPRPAPPPLTANRALLRSVLRICKKIIRLGQAGSVARGWLMPSTVERGPGGSRPADSL